MEDGHCMAAFVLDGVARCSFNVWSNSVTGQISDDSHWRRPLRVFAGIGISSCIMIAVSALAITQQSGGRVDVLIVTPFHVLPLEVHPDGWGVDLSRHHRQSRLVGGWDLKHEFIPSGHEFSRTDSANRKVEAMCSVLGVRYWSAAARFGVSSVHFLAIQHSTLLVLLTLVAGLFYGVPHLRNQRRRNRYLHSNSQRQTEQPRRRIC